jgi:hypothetical protein
MFLTYPKCELNVSAIPPKYILANMEVSIGEVKGGKRDGNVYCGDCFRDFVLSLGNPARRFKETTRCQK